MKLSLALIFAGSFVASLPGAVLTIPNFSILATNSAGVSFTLSSSYAASDTVSAIATGSVDLASGSFTTNAAGVIVAPATTNTGAHPGQTSPNTSNPALPFGALLIGNSTIGYFALFPANAADGLGSAVPPTSLSVSQTFASLFGSGLAAGTVLNLVVSDCTGCYGDNSGGFTTGVPEPATLGLSALLVTAGLVFRRKRLAQI